MRVRVVEPLKDSQGNFKYEQGQKMGIKSWTHTGREIYYAKEIKEGDPRFGALHSLLERQPVSFFVGLGQKLLHYLGDRIKTRELVIMTDFSDPRPLQGLYLMDEEGGKSLKDIYYIAFNTEWETIHDGAFEEIFGHELSHLWLYLMGFDPQKMCSTRYHEVTTITDAHTAFMEGFAEHLELVSYEHGLDALAREKFSGIIDHGLDINAFLCYRDTRVRYWWIKQNRAVYEKHLPDLEKYTDYIQLHIDDVTTTTLLIERLKNGNQILSSEGAIASLFYHIYQRETLQQNFQPPAFYEQFNTRREDVTPLENLYLKILSVMADLNYSHLSWPMVDFINAYGERFPQEREEVIQVFLDLTHYTTVSHEARELFSRHYLLGRRAQIPAFKGIHKKVLEFKKDMLHEVLNHSRSLDQALYPQIWVESPDTPLPPCPWIPDRTTGFVLDLNGATCVDYMILTGLNKEKAQLICEERDRVRGFSSWEQFKEIGEKFINTPLLPR